jgi:hypothetical protein
MFHIVTFLCDTTLKEVGIQKEEFELKSCPFGKSFLSLFIYKSTFRVQQTNIETKDMRLCPSGDIKDWSTSSF